MQECQAFAVKDGRFIDCGSNTYILDTYKAAENTDLHGKFVYPGLIDAHSHFYGLGKFMQQVDLTGATSWDECVERCRKYFLENKPAVLLGRGWDQNLWPDNKFPVNDKLNGLFPNTAVLLKRVDGHAAIANQYLLQLANISGTTRVSGGLVMLEHSKPSGLLIDNAVDLVEAVLPKPDLHDKINAMQTAQAVCFDYGLTSVCDAGLEADEIDLIDSLQKAGALSIRIYAMVSISEKNIDTFLKRGVYKTDKLNVCSFKMYADGALGSRGACLLRPYSDLDGHSGFLLTSADKMKEYAERIAKSDFQLNTHCIGDSANRYVLQLYGNCLGAGNNRRWRIEHAQVVNPMDIVLFRQFNIIPSVQPTHASSDMFWADERLGAERIHHAYTYKNLLGQNGWLPLGTDFPVENVSPFFTFYAAVTRQSENREPTGGFEMENALSREEALRGMTVWAAKAAFEETEKGSIENGKLADFIVLDLDLLKEPDMEKIHNLRPGKVFVGGKAVK